MKIEEEKEIEEFLEKHNTHDKVKRYVYDLEFLARQLDRVREAGPECPVHGKGCIPYIIEYLSK